MVSSSRPVLQLRRLDQLQQSPSRPRIVAMRSELSRRRDEGSKRRAGITGSSPPGSCVRQAGSPQLTTKQVLR